MEHAERGGDKWIVAVAGIALVGQCDLLHIALAAWRKDGRDVRKLPGSYEIPPVSQSVSEPGS